MSKYICVEDFIKWTEEILCKNCDKHDDCDNCPYAEIMEDLLHFEAADVEPVVHAKWEDVPLNMDPTYFAYKYNLRKKCTACGYAMPREYPNFKACPCCRAKMDKE